METFPPLDPDETILWEGRPDTKLRFGIETMATGIFAVALILACLGLATVIDRATPGYFWVILLPGIGIGAVIVLAYPVIESLARRATHYRLTNKRAIVRGPKGKATTEQSQNGYPIPPVEDLIYRDGTPPSIYFAARHTKKGPKGRRINHDVGFERIAEARSVFPMMLDAAKALHS